jgi:hypothetical protein
MMAENNKTIEQSQRVSREMEMRLQLKGGRNFKYGAAMTKL